MATINDDFPYKSLYKDLHKAIVRQSKRVLEWRRSGGTCQTGRSWSEYFPDKKSDLIGSILKIYAYQLQAYAIAVLDGVNIEWCNV